LSKRYWCVVIDDKEGTTSQVQKQKERSRKLASEMKWEEIVKSQQKRDWT
jgi:predicted DNA-binding protein (MmcQ/YjbR family)